MSTSFTPEKVQGAGQWASGTVVREIEGHMNPKNNPSNAPIGKHGGVPDVDYDASKLKDKLSGNSSKTGTAEPSSKTTNTSI